MPKRFTQAVTTVSGLTGLSRIFGFVRDQLLAAFIGPGVILDAWFAAFRIPNIFRRIFAEGAMSAAFVPLLRGSSMTITRWRLRPLPVQPLACFF